MFQAVRFTRLACPLTQADPLNLRPSPIGENSIEFAQYNRKMHDWKRRGETTKIKQTTHPIEWAWSLGKPALGFKPECVPTEWEYLPDDEQLAYLTRTSLGDATTFQMGETLDARTSDPVPDYLRAREVGFNLTSMELAFAHDDGDDESDASPGSANIGETGLAEPKPLPASEPWGQYHQPTPYMRSWVDWEKRRKYSGNVIRCFPINRNGMLDFQVEGLPKTDGNTAANLRNHWRQRAVEMIVATGYQGSVTWDDYQNWVEYNRDERQHIGMTKIQEELYYKAPDAEQEALRQEWVDRLYHEVYEADEELTDEQMRNGETPTKFLYFRNHPDRATAERFMREDHQNSPMMLGLSPTVNWLRDEEEDDTTYSERFYNYLDGVEYALLEASSKRQTARTSAQA